MRCFAALLLLLAGCGSDPLNLLTDSLPEGTTGMAYTAQMMAEGGKGDLTWATRDGALPPGLTLAADGAISGVPTEVGAFNVTIEVSDEGDQSDSRSFSISIFSFAIPRSVASIFLIVSPYVRFRSRRTSGSESDSC